MQLDGFTVIAQIVNFLILTWLLKRFLYRPITQAIAERQQKITAVLEQAQRQIEQAEAEKLAYQARQAELKTQREAWLNQAQQAAAAQREAWLIAARAEIDAIRADWLAAWRREQAEQQRALQREAAHRLTAAVRDALRTLADADLEARMLAPLLAQLRALDADDLSALAQAAQNGGVVTTAFALDAARQAEWRNALGEVLGGGIALTFRPDPEAACGVTLDLSGHRLAWTLDSYLDNFSQHLDSVLTQPPTPALTVASHHAAL